MKKFPLFTALLCCSLNFSFASPAIDTSADRFETDIQVPLKRLGTISPKDVSQTSNTITLGCETLDRDYADYHKYKQYISPLGLKKIRIQGGWAKTEKQKGVYSFEWLDSIIDDAHARGLTVLLQTSYGNPIYKGGGTPFLAGGMPKSAEAKKAWDNWVIAMAKRYKSKNVEWEIWNEPDLPKDSVDADAVEMNVHTARLIKSEIPDAKIAALALARTNPDRFRSYMEGFKKAGALDLFTWITHHGYRYRPEDLDKDLDPLQEILNEYPTKIKLRQGELGAPSTPNTGGALGKHGWNELSQAKWDVRRVLSDHGRGNDSAVFSIADMHYDGADAIKFTNTKGLLKTDLQNNVLHIKKSYYAVQNMAAVFDLLRNPIPAQNLKLTAESSASIFGYADSASGIASIVFWLDGGRPANTNTISSADIEIKGAKFDKPAWVDIISGRVYEIPQSSILREGDKVILKNLPIYDSPALVTDISMLSLQ